MQHRPHLGMLPVRMLLFLLAIIQLQCNKLYAGVVLKKIRQLQQIGNPIGLAYNVGVGLYNYYPSSNQRRH